MDKFSQRIGSLLLRANFWGGRGHVTTTIWLKLFIASAILPTVGNRQPPLKGRMDDAMDEFNQRTCACRLRGWHRRELVRPSVEQVVRSRQEERRGRRRGSEKADKSRPAAPRRCSRPPPYAAANPQSRTLALGFVGGALLYIWSSGPSRVTPCFGPTAQQRTRFNMLPSYKEVPHHRAH